MEKSRPQGGSPVPILKKRVSTASRALTEKLGSSTVIVHLGTDCIYELNTTAGRVWELAQGGATQAEILEQLLLEYDIPEAQLASELNDFLTELAADRLLDIGD